MTNPAESMWTFNRVGLLSQGFTLDGGFTPLGTIADFPEDMIPPPGWLPTNGSWVSTNDYATYSGRLSPTNNMTAVTACSLFEEDGTTPFVGTPVSHGLYMTNGGTKLFFNATTHSLRLVSIPGVEAAALAGKGPVILTTSRAGESPFLVLVAQTVEGGGAQEYRFFSTDAPTVFPIVWTEHTFAAMPTPPAAPLGSATTIAAFIYFVTTDKDVWVWTPWPPTQAPILANPVDCNWDARKADYSPSFIPGTAFLHRTAFEPGDDTSTPAGYGYEIQGIGSLGKFYTLKNGSWNQGSEVPLLTDLIEDTEGYPIGAWVNRGVYPLNVGYTRGTVNPVSFPIYEYPEGIQTVRGYNYAVNFASPPTHPSPLIDFVGVTSIRNSFRWPIGVELHISVLNVDLVTGFDQWGDPTTEPGEVILVSKDRATWFPVHHALVEGVGITPLNVYTGIDPTGTLYGSQHYVLTQEGGLLHLEFADLNKFKLPTSTAAAGFKRYICVKAGEFADPGFGSNGAP